MPSSLRHPLRDASGLQLTLHGDDGQRLSFATVFAGWRDPADPSLRRVWTEALCALPYTACFLELPPLHTAMLARAFECVCLDAPALAAVPGPADRDSFRRAFAIDDGTPFASFDNLGGDARLIAPRPGATADTHHLLRFLRSADAATADALWQRLAEDIDARLSPRPVWLSTAGLGVHWLHLRLDDRPKYFRHRPYAQLD